MRRLAHLTKTKQRKTLETLVPKAQIYETNHPADRMLHRSHIAVVGIYSTRSGFVRSNNAAKKTRTVGEMSARTLLADINKHALGTADSEGKILVIDPPAVDSAFRLSAGGRQSRGSMKVLSDLPEELLECFSEGLLLHRCNRGQYKDSGAISVDLELESSRRVSRNMVLTSQKQSDPNIRFLTNSFIRLIQVALSLPK